MNKPQLSSSAPWQITSRREVYRNPWTTVWEDQLEHESGRPGLYGHLAPIESIVICPQLADGSIMLVRQWRHAWQLNSWECPCGRMEENESAIDAAQRELAEECQLQSDHVIALGTWTPADSRVGGRVHGFVALNATPIASSHQRDESEIDLITESVSFTDALSRIEHSLSRLTLFESQAYLQRR